MLFEELRCADCIPGNGVRRLRTVRKSRGVAEIKVVRFRRKGDQLLEDGQSAKAGIEYADTGSSSRGHLWNTS